MSDPSKTNSWTFAFVDLAGFTALTEAHGDHEAAALIGRFVALARAALGERDRFVKSIGDAVMLAAPTPVEGIQSVARLVQRCVETDGFPVPRVGLHAGPAVEQNGDFFGGAVNLAARVASRAAGGQVLATSMVADAARELDISVVGLGPVHFRNVADAVELHEVVVCPDLADALVDPVCRMQVRPSAAAGRLRHDGTEYCFCSFRCVAAFVAAPDGYHAVASRGDDT